MERVLKNPPIRLSRLEETFALHLKAKKITGFEREYRFDDKRRWRVDFAWPELKIAVEIEGGTYTQGRHNRGNGFENDCEKYNALTEQGWSLFRYTGAMVKSGEALKQIERILQERLALPESMG